MVYAKPGDAPWEEWKKSIGKVMASAEKPLVKALTGTDPNGGKTTLPNKGGATHTLYFKNADVVGNPVAFLFNTLSKGRNNGPSFTLPRPHTSLGGDGEPKYPEPEEGDKDDTNKPPVKQVDGSNLANRVKGAIPSPSEIGSRIKQLPGKIQSTVSQKFSDGYSKAKSFPGKVKSIFSKKPKDGEDSAAQSLLKDFGNFDAMSDSRFAEIVDVDSVKQAMSIQNEIGEFSKIAQKMDSAASAFGGGTGGNIFCPSEVGPLNPYFVSGIDSMGWRLGFPDRFSLNTWLPHRQVIGKFPLNKWGKIYPRQGLMYAIDEPKTAAVIAERAMHIVTRPKENHVYAHLKGPQHNAGKGDWQMLHPTSSKVCKTFGTTRKFPFKSSKDGSYAFNYWRPYSCCLDPQGIHLKTIMVPKLCF